MLPFIRLFPGLFLISELTYFCQQQIKYTEYGLFSAYAINHKHYKKAIRIVCPNRFFY